MTLLHLLLCTLTHPAKPFRVPAEPARPVATDFHTEPGTADDVMQYGKGTLPLGTSDP